MLLCVPPALVFASALASTPPMAAHIEAVFVRVPAGFALASGLADGPAAGGGATRSWVLSAREARMLRAAIDRDCECEVVARPEMLVADNSRQIAFSYSAVEDGYRLRCDLEVAPGGRSVRLDLGGRLWSGKTLEAAGTVPVGGALAVLRGGVLVVATVARLEAAEG